MNYSANDIDAYLKGQLSPAQMHAMEKAALDDPFLAEAMEGYAGMQDVDWKTALEKARIALQEKNNEAKIIPFNQTKFRWLKTAAAILVIIAGTALTYYLTREKSSTIAPQEIAQQIPVNKTPDSIDPSTIKLNIPRPLKTNDSGNGLVTISPSKGLKGSVKPTQINSNVYTITTQNGASATATTNESTVNQDLAANKPVPPASNTITPVVTVPFPLSAESKQIAVNDAEQVKKTTAYRAMGNNKTVTANRYFGAKVLGPDNSPLPFANVNVKNENFGTYADAFGNFRLVSADTVITVEVKSVGYESRTFNLRSNTPVNTIVLKEDAALVKTTTMPMNPKMGETANRTYSPRIRMLKDSVYNVEPADGWDKYNTYIANNLELPEMILDKEAHGEMLISFDVKPNGAISNIKVNDTDCGNCEAIAKKLLEKGPQWKVKNGKKTSAKIKLQY